MNDAKPRPRDEACGVRPLAERRKAAADAKAHRPIWRLSFLALSEDPTKVLQWKKSISTE
jgi:hypothetical protein